MNNDRRKELKKIIKKFESLKETLQDIKIDVDWAYDEENDAYESMPEGLQNSSKGETIEENLTDLDWVRDDIFHFINSVDTWIENYNNVIER